VNRPCGKDNLGAFGFHEGICRQNNVICFLEEHARLSPERIALEWVSRETMHGWNGVSPLIHALIKNKDFYEKICTVSAGLKRLGISKGDRVIIFVPLSLELYLTMFAVQRSGAIAVFLDSWARKGHLGVCAQVVRPKAMISFEKALELCLGVPELANIQVKIVVGPHEKRYTSDLEKLLRCTEGVEIEPVESNDTALITFTTGSSGVPKGADRTHKFLAAQHRALDKEIPYIEKDVDLPVFPIFSLNNLAAGVTTVLPAIDLASPSDRDAAIIVSQIFSQKISCCTVSPSIFIKIAQHCRINNIVLDTLRRVVTGGAPVSKDNVRDFKAIAPQAEILVLYGSTEVEPIAGIEANEMLQDKSEGEGVNVGRISPDLEYKFIRIFRGNIELGPKGWQEWEVEKGKAGELVVSGAHVCENYYNNPEAFKSTKIKEANGKIWHRSGDVGILDEKGRLWLVGRVHNTIVRQNEYLFPVHAEILLKRLDFVRQSAFLGIEDAKLGERACAVFSLKDGFKRELKEQYANTIMKLLRDNKIPVDEVRMVEEIPMDPRHHSKVEYSKLREMLVHV
jgi:acyl-CoA synthetase (AMP-forming)/AMP-acid ligase II